MRHVLWDAFPAVCASAGDANQAFAVFQKAKAAEQQIAAAAAAASAAAGADSRQQKAAGKAAPKMDGHVYGALIAACAQAIRVRSSDLREQLVILERAFQVCFCSRSEARGFSVPGRGCAVVSWTSCAVASDQGTARASVVAQPVHAGWVGDSTPQGLCGKAGAALTWL